MQNYGQQPGYQPPGSAGAFAGQQQPAPPPPGYGGYQSTAPPNQNQWAPPAQHQGQNQQWGQPQQQAASGYNPGTYGTMPGVQQPQAYPPQQHDQPPPPPPKPYGFAAAVQQQQNQNWPQQSQHPTSNTPQQHGGYPVPGGTQNQQSYNQAAPPPPSATPGASYFPPAQGGRPGSVYGANQAGSFANTPQHVPPQPPSVMSPNEQQPAYIPPSLTGQGVQAYMPANTNPMPGVYVPPPPDVPAWQQAQHAPLQGGGKKFRYTKPTVDPGFYAQGYQGTQSQQPPVPPKPYDQSTTGVPHPQQPPGPPPPSGHYVSQGQVPQQPPHQQQPQYAYGQQPAYGQNAPQPGQVSHQPTYSSPYGPNAQAQQLQHPGQYSQPNQPPPPPPQMASNMSKPQNEWEIRPAQTGTPEPHRFGASNVSKPVNQWDIPAQAPAPAGQTWDQYQQKLQEQNVYAQPQNQPNQHQAQASQSSMISQPYAPTPEENIQAPKPLARTDTASSDFFSQPSLQSQPVSPVNNRQSMSFTPGHVGRTDSVSSIALANLHAQRDGNRTVSPKPPPPKLPTPPPPRDDKSKFSALGSGGPSDWEHFGADAEIDDEEIFAKKPRPAELDSSEVVANEPEPRSGPSPPSTHGWPSPPASASRQDTYQPTPPPVVATLVDRTAPQQNFVPGDAGPAPLSISPKPSSNSRPPSTQQSFQVNDGAWQPPKQGTPAQQQVHHQPPPAQQSFVVDDGGWGAQSSTSRSRQQTPSQQPQQPPPVTTSFVMGDEISQRTPTQYTKTRDLDLVEQHAAELRTKDEALERLRTDTENEKANLNNEITKLKTVIDTTKAQTSEAAEALQKQVADMKLDVDQAKSLTDAAAKEKELTIERMKEDVEGKEHNIEERDTIIADLRRQLEAEKSKEPIEITPTVADLIPDLDPWYAGSLERYIAMLRAEAGEPQLDNKIKTFRAFMKAESGIRGIEFYDAPPPVSTTEAILPVPDSKASNVSKPVLSRDDMTVQVAEPQRESPDDEDIQFSPGGRPALNPHVPKPPIEEPPAHYASNVSKPALTRDDLNVQVPTAPHVPSDEDDYDYSPGGRPVLKSKKTTSNEQTSAVQPFHSSAQSTTILTPTSSVDDDSNKTPVQSASEDQSQPAYKAYVPPGLVSSISAQSMPRQSMSAVPAPASSIASGTKSFETRPITVRTGTGKHHDEIFFGASGEDASRGSSRPASSDSATPDVPIPAPLAFGSNRPLSTAPPSRKDPLEALADLLPTEIAPATPNALIEELRAKLSHVKQDTADIEDLTKKWDVTATVTRKKNDVARRKREEEQEEDNSDAFNNEEISYADLNIIEQEFKQKENDLKAQEDRAEYASYVEAVFDPVYEALQSDIKSLMDLDVEAENLAHTSQSGVAALEPDSLNTLATLELLQEIHTAILDLQDKVVHTVAERDKRYKKTEISPLYARGDIAKMKAVEKHFDAAEKTAHVRALRDKAGRVGELVAAFEDIVVSAVGVEQREIERIISALRNLDDGSADLSKTTETLSRLKASSKATLKLFNDLEIRHNAAVLDAEIAQARMEGGDVAKLEEEKRKGESKFLEEFERRVRVIEQDREEVEGLVERKGSEDAQRERRLKAALEEAKRRNGDV
ncbi:hypothetical protein HBI60_052680 [Parastagonospora nodorum]|nr:hypothetical protein HBI60_052680 [Parastagonospora nodorum]